MKVAFNATSEMLVVFFKQTVIEDRHKRLALKWWIRFFYKLSALCIINLKYWLAFIKLIDSLHDKAITSFLQYQIESEEQQGFFLNRTKPNF